MLRDKSLVTRISLVANILCPLEGEMSLATSVVDDINFAVQRFLPTKFELARVNEGRIELQLLPNTELFFSKRLAWNNFWGEECEEISAPTTKEVRLDPILNLNVLYQL